MFINEKIKYYNNNLFLINSLIFASVNKCFLYSKFKCRYITKLNNQNIVE